MTGNQQLVTGNFFISMCLIKMLPVKELELIEELTVQVSDTTKDDQRTKAYC